MATTEIIDTIDIVTVPTTGGAPTMTAEIINAKWTNAQLWFNRAYAFGDDVQAAIGAAPQGLFPTLDQSYLPPDAPVLTFDDPNAAMAYFDAENAELSAMIDDAFQRMLGDTFPDMAYVSNALAWCNRAIQEGGTGINTGVEQALWERGRSRIQQEAMRAEADVTNQWARRGFPLPPGALVHQVGLIQQDSRNKLAETSRDIAVKSFETEIENVRFAVKSVLDQYIQALQAVGDYVKTIMLGPQIAMQLATSMSGLKNDAARTLTAFYQAQSAAIEPRVRLAIADAQIQTQGVEANLRAKEANDAQRAAAAMANLKMIGDAAAASLNGIGSGASISGQDVTSI